MKVLRFTYPPSGKISLDEISHTCSGWVHEGSGKEMNRMEIYNSGGELVYIVKDWNKVKKLPLEQGFYLLRVRDSNGKVLKNGKLVF